MAIIEKARNFVAELIYMCVLPILLIMVHQNSLLGFGYYLPELVIASFLFSFAFPNLSMLVNIVFLVILINNSLPRYFISGYRDFDIMFDDALRSFSKLFNDVLLKMNKTKYPTNM
jgi:hypothetical protein